MVPRDQGFFALGCPFGFTIVFRYPSSIFFFASLSGLDVTCSPVEGAPPPHPATPSETEEITARAVSLRIICIDVLQGREQSGCPVRFRLKYNSLCAHGGRGGRFPVPPSEAVTVRRSRSPNWTHAPHVLHAFETVDEAYRLAQPEWPGLSCCPSRVKNGPTRKWNS